MAGPLLKILIRLKANKYHRMQIAARYRILDLLKQIAEDLHLPVDQLVHISIYRSSASGYLLLYPINKNFTSTPYDVSIPLDKFGFSSNEELYIDLTDLMHCQNQDNDDLLKTSDNDGASSSLNSSDALLSKVDDATSLIQAKTTSNSSSKKSLIGQLVRFPVPADNSCLFSSIYFVLHSGKLDLAANKYLRNLVASKIESDHLTYSEAILGRTNADYCKWIRRGTSSVRSRHRRC
jgi:hypothetical protein